VGAILVQMDENGIERPIQYISHQLSATQKRWPVIEKEAYALIYALQKLRPYLLGAEYTVYTDHKPLKSLFTKEMANTKIQRWGILLAEYGATIEYKKGIHNLRADTLSRLRSDSGLGEAEVFAVRVAAPELPGDFNLEELKAAQRVEFADLIADAVDPEGGDESVLYGGVLFSEKLPHPGAVEGPRLVLPAQYQQNAIETAHKEVGHMSISKTRKRITEDFVWPGLNKTVKHFVEACPACAVFREQNQWVPMQEVEIPYGPMQKVHLDFIGPFVEDPKGNKYVLMAIDYLTGWAEAYPLPTQSAASIIDAITLGYYPDHGAPVTFVSDNGQGFGSHQWTDFCGQSGVECRRTTPVHPQGNSKVERLNRTVKDILVRLQRNRPPDWYLHLPAAIHAYRIGISDSTGYSPFYLLYGRPPKQVVGEIPPVGDEFGNRLDLIATARRAARGNLEESRRYNRRRLLQKANTGISLSVGDSVCVKAEERTIGTAYWDPGFIVTRVRGTTHWVNNPDTGISKTLHREKVKVVNHIETEGLRDIPARPRRKFAKRTGVK
jgi:hypothetical protein